MQLSWRPRDAAAATAQRTAPVGSPASRRSARVRGRNELQVGLFVTCLVDLFRPSIGFAALKLFEAAGCGGGVPAAQTCARQPGYNSGDRAGAQVLARKVLREFGACEYVVVPSGSCGGMIRTH